MVQRGMYWVVPSRHFLDHVYTTTKQNVLFLSIRLVDWDLYHFDQI